MELSKLVEISGAITVILGLLGLLWRYFGSPCWKFTKRLKANSKEIVDSLPFLLAIARQWPLLPEDGSLDGIIKDLKRKATVNREWVHFVLNHLHIPAFETNELGSFTWVSEEFSEVTGLFSDHYLGDGWITGVVESDRQRVYEEWKRCVKSGRVFDIKFSLIDREDNITKVKCVGHAMKTNEEHNCGFIAILEKI
jgi:PAS domain-containing protein